MVQTTNHDRRLVDLYESDLVQIIDMRVQAALKEAGQSEGKQRKVVHGLEGIAKTIGKSHSTAWRMKKEGAFDGYISQIGNSISAYEDDIIQAGKEYFKKRQAEKKIVKKPRRIIFK